MQRTFIEQLLIMLGFRMNHRIKDKEEIREVVAHKVAWAAVEKKYYKNEDGKWVEIE